MSPQFKSGLNDLMYDLKVPNKASFKITMGQVALGFTFRLTCYSIARHKSSDAMALVKHIL